MERRFIGKRMTRTLIKNVSVVTLENIQENHSILLDDQHIESIFPTSQMPPLQADRELDGRGSWACAGLIDVHIHGFGGHGPEQNSAEDLWAMSDLLARHGVTAFCPTLYCAQPQRMCQQLEKLVPVIGREKGAQILGFHLEGPFISPQKPGAMKPQDIVAPDVKIMEELYRAAHGHITQITLAPELENIAPVIRFCLQHHIVAQAGHTNATYEEFRRGVTMGVTHATHAFNAMSAFNQRAPGAIGAVLMSPDVSCEIIGDGIHVHPQLISFLRRVKQPEQIVLVTDALTPTAQQQGPFVANADKVILEGGVWRRETDHVITGSALTMAHGVKNLVSWGYPLPQALRCASANPAQILQLKNRGQLAPGFQADITLLKSDFTPQAVFIRGRQVW